MGPPVECYHKCWHGLLIFKTPGLPQDGLGRATSTATLKRSSLIFLPATSMDNEESKMLERDRVYLLEWLRKTWNVESPRDLRADLCSFVWDSGVRDQDVEFCIREEQRNSTVVLALRAIQITCLRVYEELKVDETRLLRLHFSSDLSPRQPGLIPGVLFGEAILRNLNRAYPNRRIADFRRRNLAMTPASSSVQHPCHRLLLLHRCLHLFFLHRL